jgi:hypothetical protein
VGGFQLLLGGLVFLDGRLQAVAGGLELVLELKDLAVLLCLRACLWTSLATTGRTTGRSFAA